MPKDMIRRKQVGEFMKKNLNEKLNGAAPLISASMVAVINYLRTGSYDFAALYDKARECLEGDEPETAQPVKGKKKEPAQDYALEAIKMVLHFGNLVNSMCGDDMKQALYADSSYLLGSFNSYIGVGKNQEKKKLSARMSPVPRALSSSCGTCVLVEADSYSSLPSPTEEVEQVVAESPNGYVFFYQAERE